MSNEVILDTELKEVDDMCVYRLADGVVFGKIKLEDVTEAIGFSRGVKLRYLSVDGTRKLVRTDEGLELVAKCRITEDTFGNLCDLEIQPGGRGVFEFTGTYSHTYETSRGGWGYLPTSDTYRRSFRFHVDNTGSATYRMLDP